MIKNLLANYLTKDERKILSYFCVFLIFGMIIHYSGSSLIYADKTTDGKSALAQAVEQDTLIKVDIRTAGAEDLELLPGVGAQKALAIIEYRKTQPFDSPEEIMNIKGIGAKTYLKMKPMLVTFGISGAGVSDKQKLQDIHASEVITDEDYISSDKQELDGTDNISKKEHSEIKSVAQDDNRPVHLNTASREELLSLSGIGDKKADAILAYRKEIGKFTSIEQLLDIKGIGAKTLEKNRQRLSL